MTENVQKILSTTKTDYSDKTPPLTQKDLNEYLLKVQQEISEWKNFYQNLKLERQKLNEKLQNPVCLTNLEAESYLNFDDKHFLLQRPKYENVQKYLQNTIDLIHVINEKKEINLGIEEENHEVLERQVNKIKENIINLT